MVRNGQTARSGCSSVYDRSPVPPSSSGETLKFYCLATTIELSHGRSWDDEKKDHFERARKKAASCTLPPRQFRSAE